MKNRTDYLKEIPDLREQLRATSDNYLTSFIDHYWSSWTTKKKRIARRDLQSFLRGLSFINAYSPPYAFYPKIIKYLKHHERQPKETIEE